VIWQQQIVTLGARARGFHQITSEVVDALPELKNIRMGLLHVFIQHTSASVPVNENADPDMPAHVKASLLGSSVTVPIADGQLCLGTWQGIYLCEHRNHGGPRRLVLTVQGEEA